MRGIFSSELYKLFKRRGIWLLFLVTVLSGLLIGFIAFASLDTTLNSEQIQVSEWVFIQGNNIYNIFFIMIIVLTATFYALEYNDNTIKSVLFRGTSKVYVFISKFILNIMMIFLLLIGFILFGSIVVGMRNDFSMVFTGMAIRNYIIFAGRLTLIMAAYSSVFTFVNIVTQNLISSIAFSYGIRLLEGLIVLVVRSIGNLDWIEKMVVANYDFHLYTTVTKAMKDEMLICVVITITFMIISLICFCKQDIKK